MNPKGSPPANTSVSIITKSDVRYEGTLFNINPNEQTLTLINVKSYGTEGRRPGNEISGSQEIFSSIVFKGNDIKDLQVIEKTEVKEAAPKKETHEKKNQEDFDFARMNEKFEKLSIQNNEAKKFGKYKKSLFFDSISNSTVEKNEEAEARNNRREQAKVDMETFGNDYMKSKNTMRGYNRGNRGNRGNYRGNRGRGGNNTQGGSQGVAQGGSQGYQGRGNYRGGGGRGGRGNRGGYHNARGGTEEEGEKHYKNPNKFVYVEKK